MIDGLPTSRTCPFDPPPELAELRADAPVTRMRYPDGHEGWLVTSFDLAREVLAGDAFSARHELRSSPIPMPVKIGPAAPGMFIGMDPPDHTRYRKPLSRTFTTRRTRELEPEIARICAETLDAMERQGSPADLMKAFALPLPVLVISKLLGATPEVAEEFQALRVPVLTAGTPKEEAMAAARRTGELMGELVAYRRANPGDDLLSALIADSDLDSQELAGISLLILGAGHETTANMISLATYFLMSEERSLPVPFTDDAVNELLRHLSVVQFVSRAALRDVRLGPVTIKAGETVTLSLSAVNRDPGRFPDPDTARLDRDASSHLAFGHGLHQCIGHNLARAEIRIGLSELFTRFPKIRLAVPDEEITTREAMNTHGVHALPVEW
uniref:PyrE2 n=1 Tax=Streptomyces rugosporus TaxID=295838 RepID=K7R6G6_STRRG|nr:PyrE2 [Streptomyces rugosporus]